MGLLVILILTEVFTLVALHQHFYARSKTRYFLSLLIHIILSLWLWRLYIEIELYNDFYDTSRHIWMLMNMTGMVIAVVFPRFILIMFHFTGKLIRLRSGRHIYWLTDSGLVIMGLIITIIAFGTFHGRFNFKTEAVTIKIKGLHEDLDGIKIVQLSDLHLSTFYNNSKLLQMVMERVNSYNPDIILNTGDFVSYGWREFERNDTILSKIKSRYGNYAVMGNHDFGTYHPYYTKADKENNVSVMHKLIKLSGYIVLNDENTVVKAGNARIGLIGVTTMGRHPNIIHGDLTKAMKGLDNVDIKILLSHDPNHWTKNVTGKTDIDLTLSGHTHGMQMGILTKNFRWSPSQYFYPHWSGIYTEGNQVLYVNRGLGVLAIPFRIWMPPEITIITLINE